MKPLLLNFHDSLRIIFHNFSLKHLHHWFLILNQIKWTVFRLAAEFDYNIIIFDYLILDVAIDHVEGGIYIGPEFLMGQVYDGGVNSEDMDGEARDITPLYRPIYITVIRSSSQISASTADKKK